MNSILNACFGLCLTTVGIEPHDLSSRLGETGVEPSDAAERLI
ncbi:MAG: hypothetical protein ACRD6X_20910 [Pyrinomonadaceae bacterium]